MIRLKDYQPLTADDRDLLARWGCDEDDVKARSIVLLGRVQRWFNRTDKRLMVDGKMGPRTTVKIRGCTWTEEERAILDDLGMRGRW
jgi:hypothetical protein